MKACTWSIVTVAIDEETCAVSGGVAPKILIACDTPGPMTMFAGCALSGGGAAGDGVAVAKGDGNEAAGDGSAVAEAEIDGVGRGEASCAAAEPPVAARSASVSDAARLRELFVPNGIRTGRFVNGTAGTQVLEVREGFH